MRTIELDRRTIHSLSCSIPRVYRTNAVPAQSIIAWNVGHRHMNQVGARSSRTSSLDQPLTYFDLSIFIWQFGVVRGHHKSHECISDTSDMVDVGEPINSACNIAAFRGLA